MKINSTQNHDKSEVLQKLSSKASNPTDEASRNALEREFTEVLDKIAARVSSEQAIDFSVFVVTPATPVKEPSPIKAERAEVKEEIEAIKVIRKEIKEDIKDERREVKVGDGERGSELEAVRVKPKQPAPEPITPVENVNFVTDRATVLQLEGEAASRLEYVKDTPQVVEPIETPPPQITPVPGRASVVKEEAELALPLKDTVDPVPPKVGPFEVRRAENSSPIPVENEAVPLPTEPKVVMQQPVLKAEGDVVKPIVDQGKQPLVPEVSVEQLKETLLPFNATLLKQLNTKAFERDALVSSLLISKAADLVRNQDPQALLKLNQPGAIPGVARSAEVRERLANLTPTMPRSLIPQTMEKVEAVLKEAIRAKDGKTLTVRLDPPNLGQIKADVTIKEGSLHARITAETQAVSNLLREHSHDLHTALRKLGLQVERITIAVQSADNFSHTHLGAHEERFQQAENRHAAAGSAQVIMEELPLNHEIKQLDHWVA